MMSNPAPLLVTRRLFIRPWQENDLPATIAFCSDPKVMKQVGDGHPWSREESRTFLQQEILHQQFHGFCRWAVVENGQESPVGFCGFVPAREGVEMGWRLASRCWGRGLASEVAAAVLHHGQQELDLDPIMATIQAGNQASCRVAEKIGLVRAGTLARDGHHIVIFQAPACSSPAPGSDVS